jgi:hypothetical protein
MATSGTYTFNLDVDQIIQEASEMIGGEQTSGNEVESAKRSINLLLTDWQNRGVSLWTVNTTVVSVAASTTSIDLPNATIDVLEAVWQVSTSSELQMSRISMEEYMTITNKSQSGRPNQYAVRRKVDNPEVFFYPIPDSSTQAVKFEQFKKIQNVSQTALENVDIPTRFLPPMTMGLAYHMGIKRPNIPTERISMLKVNYEELLQNAMEEDRERSSLFFKPKLR